MTARNTAKRDAVFERGTGGKGEREKGRKGEREKGRKGERETQPAFQI